VLPTQTTAEFIRIKDTLFCQLKLHGVDPLIQLSYWMLDNISLRIKDFAIISARFSEKSFVRTLLEFLDDVKSHAMTKVQSIVRGALVRMRVQRQKEKVQRLIDARKLASTRIKSYRVKWSESRIEGENLTDYFHIDRCSLVTNNSGLLGGSEVFVSSTEDQDSNHGDCMESDTSSYRKRVSVGSTSLMTCLLDAASAVENLRGDVAAGASVETTVV
jgi:hypothetical protein